MFTFSKEIGRGLPLWLPNGTIIRDELEQWARQTERRLKYQRVVTPHITREDLYYLSGHLPYYSEDLYAPIDIEGEQYYLRPMNCPTITWCTGRGPAATVSCRSRSPNTGPSIARFVAFLTEHFAGAFPVWLAPEQVRIIPIMPELSEYADEVCDILVEAGLRADVDSSDGRLNGKVRAAVTRKIPLIVVIGRREAEQRTVSVRTRSGQEVSMSLDTFVSYANELVRSKSLDGAGHLRSESTARGV